MMLGCGASSLSIEISLRVVEGMPSSRLYSLMFLTAMTYYVVLDLAL
jgi:hypothetical protein